MNIPPRPCQNTMLHRASDRDASRHGAPASARLREC